MFLQMLADLILCGGHKPQADFVTDGTSSGA